ncbi:hypothetical protein EV379_1241 [Microterricola gilva]|uniref:Minor structural protein GP20 n=1 Tax=Microterricola gilva TaxID=393267 RepID=A0A4Q8AKA2_9MICO|nr:hypothetical protein [Microterricola gilva]RZU64930.1 hypothetical protein EV379_1241 [Microterricola gilva]
MTNTDESVTDESTESTESVEQTETESESTEEIEQPDPNAGAHKALVAERTARKAAEKELKALRDANALKDKPAEEQALEQARIEARAEATEKANKRLIGAELKAAATGKVKNPALALKLIDTSGIDVDDDGEVDSDALNQAIAALLVDYPELAADGGSRFGGGADQGAKGKTSKPAQLSEQDIKSMTPEQIGAARAAGQLNTLLGIK